jgi:hypothetical protein
VKALSSLDLSWNRVGARGIVSLAASGLGPSRLQTLDVSWNHFWSKDGHVGAALGAALEGNRQLTHFDLGFNRMTPLDCEALGRHLKANRRVMGVHLSGNEGGVDGYGFVTTGVNATATEVS